MSDPINSVFVYGTLKRGQVRESMWPCRPIEVQIATIRASLHDLGPYPAITLGTDDVGGELWRFQIADVAETLKVLDEIEWFQQDDNDLYIRQVVNCHKVSGGSEPAFTYFYASPLTLTDNNRIRPNKTGVCNWPTHG